MSHDGRLKFVDLYILLHRVPSGMDRFTDQNKSGSAGCSGCWTAAESEEWMEVSWTDPNTGGLRVLWYYQQLRAAFSLSASVHEITSVSKRLHCFGVELAMVFLRICVLLICQLLRLRFTGAVFCRRVEQGAGNDLPDIYEFTYRYWSLRENPGFERLVPPIEELWWWYGNVIVICCFLSVTEQKWTILKFKSVPFFFHKICG